jgi:hypothetical protein
MGALSKMETMATLQDFAKRVVKCRKSWVWRDGMRQDQSIVSLDVRLPDFTDAATVRGLLDLVREAWRNPLISPSANVASDQSVAFTVTVNYDGLSFSGSSETEALVKALEAAEIGRVI